LLGRVGSRGTAPGRAGLWMRSPDADLTLPLFDVPK
jgi:hypothetical protein